MSRDGLQIEGLDQWLKWLKGLENEDVDRMKSRVLRSVAAQGLDNTRRHMPPNRTSRLQGSMSMSDKDNLFSIKVGKTSWVFYGTAVAYAAAVNNGFQQDKGRYVPGFWKNGTFHYQPNYKDGMVLTGKFVEGAHMFEKGIKDLEDGDFDKIVEFEFSRLYAELFKGG